MSPSNFSAATSAASLMGLLEMAPWRLTPSLSASESADSLGDLQAESATSPLPDMPGHGLGWGDSFASTGCVDGAEISRSFSDGLRIRNTFIHLDRRDCVDADAELCLPIKSVSAPSMEILFSPLPRRSDSSLLPDESPSHVLEEPRKGGRTPKVTFDLTPSFLCCDEVPVEHQTRRIARADSLPGNLSRASRFVEQRKAAGDVPLYEVKNTFIQFDKSQAEDCDISLPVRSVSAPSMPIEIWSPTACPAKVCLKSLASDVQLSTAQFAPSSPGTPAKVLSASLEGFSMPASPHTPVGLPLSVCSVPGTSSFSSLDFWGATPAASDCAASSCSARSFRIKNTFIHVDKEVDAEDDIGFGLPTKSVSQPDLVPEQAPNSPIYVAHDLPSVGAAMHGTSLCKPCAWFWKPGGCKWGVDCGHCHLCPEGEIRRRKKERQSEMKEARAANRAA